MKAKTKRRILHVLTKKKLVKKRTSRNFLRSFLILLATISTGSLAYAITLNRPVINVPIRSTDAGGVKLTGPAAAPKPAGGGSATVGRGSWYALGLPAPDTLTCASRTFPRGTYLEVTDLYNGHTVICRVNDYGPEAWTGRIIDLSRGSFRVVDDLGRGTIPVSLRVVGGPTSYKLTVTSDFAAIVGYNLCRSNHPPAFCDQHRQE